MGVVRNLRQVDADAAGVDIAFRADVHAGLAQAQKAADLILQPQEICI